ncbi:hypothetical protein PHET_08339 [Paragonimus heterotremus]|uniref:Large ribosomal subunit protein eL20 n=1 Tax=Paragonimus heterotremus TaxID=100268 RepID=A0A8J4WF15_9TREM|nr:hypothetical protein PHET_08339 [Paragonimus heterotremus]
MRLTPQRVVSKAFHNDKTVFSGSVHIHPRKPLMVKNYGIWLRYNSRSEEGAVTQMYREMGARHRIPASKCKRPYITQFHDSKLKFPLPHRVNRNLHHPRFTTRRPNTAF